MVVYGYFMSTFALAVTQIQVATNAEFAPFESVDTNGNLLGFDIDLMNAIADAVSLQIQWQNVAWNGIFERLDAKQSDVVIAAVVVNEERKQLMDFSNPYFIVRKVILTLDEEELWSIEDFDNLNNRKLAAVQGQSGEIAAQNIFGVDNKNIISYENVDQALAALAAKQVSGMIGDSPVLENYIKTQPDKNLHLVEIPHLATQHYAIAVKIGNTDIINLLNMGLKKVQESGQYDKIYQKYFSN